LPNPSGPEASNRKARAAILPLKEAQMFDERRNHVTKMIEKFGFLFVLQKKNKSRKTSHKKENHLSPSFSLNVSSQNL